MNNYYFTFGTNHKDINGNKLWKAYVVIQAPSEEDARVTMVAQRGSSWSFCYTEEQFKGQKEEYNLHEVQLTEI